MGRNHRPLSCGRITLLDAELGHHGSLSANVGKFPERLGFALETKAVFNSWSNFGAGLEPVSATEATA